LAIQLVNSQPINAVVYPNPVTDHLIISTGTQEELTVRITDVSGKEISRQAIKGRSVVQLHELASGLYYVVISRGNEAPVVHKISKL
jgi:hypothetical protein